MYTHTRGGRGGGTDEREGRGSFFFFPNAWRGDTMRWTLRACADLKDSLQS